MLGGMLRANREFVRDCVSLECGMRYSRYGCVAPEGQAAPVGQTRTENLEAPHLSTDTDTWALNITDNRYTDSAERLVSI